MDKLDTILKAHVARGEDTTDKLLGASFIVVNKDGQTQTSFDSPPFHRLP
jgi:hypothetical protein